MRTHRGFLALDRGDTPHTETEAGMHNAYDEAGSARYCPCSTFWAGNPDPSTYVAHDAETGERLTLTQITARKENAR